MSQVALLIGLNLVLFASPGLPILLRRLMRIYATYVLIAFTARSVGLMVLEPGLESGSFALRGLLAPTYADGLSHVLPFVNLGLFVLIAATQVFARVWMNDDKPIQPGQVRLATLIGVLLVGNLLRALALLNPDGPLGQIGGRGGVIAPTVIAFVVVGTDWRRASRATRQFLIVAGVLEISWAVVQASKTPILALMIVFYLDPHRSRISAKALAGAVVGLVVAFSLVQGLKRGDNTQIDAIANPVARVTLSLSSRFDGLRAAAAARGNTGERYLLPTEYGKTLALDLLPQTLSGHSKLPAGIRWGRDVYRIPGNSTYYAETLSAEGFVVAGLMGVVIWNVAGSMILVGTAKGLRSPRTYRRMTACGVAAASALFERGLLGQAEHFGATVQGCLIIMTIVLLLDRAVASPTVRSVSAAPLAPVSPARTTTVQTRS